MLAVAVLDYAGPTSDATAPAVATSYPTGPLTFQGCGLRVVGLKILPNCYRGRSMLEASAANSRSSDSEALPRTRRDSSRANRSKRAPRTDTPARRTGRPGTTGHQPKNASTNPSGTNHQRRTGRNCSGLPHARHCCHGATARTQYHATNSHSNRSHRTPTTCRQSLAARLACLCCLMLEAETAQTCQTGRDEGKEGTSCGGETRQPHGDVSTNFVPVRA